MFSYERVITLEHVLICHMKLKSTKINLRNPSKSKWVSEIELQSSADFCIHVCTNLPGHQKERCESGRSHSVVVAYFPVMCSSSSVWFCHIAIHNFSICNPVITCFQTTLHCALHVCQGSTQYGTAVSSWSPFHTFKSVR